MSHSDRTLTTIYDKADGRCVYCNKTIRWKHYGNRGKGKGWEVDHRVPKCQGGTNSPGNLFAACWECNAQKGGARW